MSYARVRFRRDHWRPPKRLSLSDWSRRHYYLSAESSAEPGRFRPYKYQTGIMNAITDRSVFMVSVKKSARVGFTKILNSVVGYYMHQDPCPIMIVQPTVEDAEGYSKEEIGPMIRDCPSLTRIFGTGGKSKTTQDTILHKTYPGGSISMVGANSGRGFRRVSRKVVEFDEIDAYPLSAGSDGDQIKLGTMRAAFYHDRKIILGSTPLTEGKSRISEAFESGDMRYFEVPCPHCGYRDRLVFNQSEECGHWMRWPKGEPEKAHFVCFDCGCEISHDQKHAITEAGEWRATAPFRGHASFHIWAAYSSSPNATWAQLAQEFEECNAAGPEKLKTFVNTVLGETWRERGEAPDFEKLYNRREPYGIGIVPKGARFLTAGVDVQKDRLYYEVVGWGKRKESWSVDAGFLLGDTSSPEVWAQLDALLSKDFESEDGGPRKITTLAIDSGYNTQTVYNWARRYPLNRVIAVKGSDKAKALISVPSKVDVTFRGKKVGYNVWSVGVAVAKSELYGWLRLDKLEEGAFPPGYCHFPEHGEEYFKQLTAEHLVAVTTKRGFLEYRWQQLPNRENHWLDCRVYARAAASLVGMDRFVETRAATSSVPVSRATPEGETRKERSAEKKTSSRKKGGGFLSRRDGRKWV